MTTPAVLTLIWLIICGSSTLINPSVLCDININNNNNTNDNCSSLTTTIQVTLYRNIDSAPESLTLDGQIRHKKDFFHLLIANQTIPKLCQNFVLLENELSIVQFVNTSTQEIQPGAFQITPTLTLLRIAKNLLTNIDRGVFNRIRVKEIDLSDNFITTIDSQAFDNNTFLQIVKLNNNQLKDIDPRWFTNSPNVYKFSAIYNDFQTVPAQAFRNMAQDRPLKIRLSANRIRDIDPGAFSTHKEIQVLRLNGNKLASLHEDIFANLTVRHLQVNTNYLKCFPDSIFNASIEVLAFVDNVSFECSCLKKIKEFADENQVDVYYPSIICEDRARLVNIVFNFNKTYEIPLMPPTVDVDVYGDLNQSI